MTLCILGCMQVIVYEEGDERTYDMAGAFCKYLPTGSWSHRYVYLPASPCISRYLPVSPDWELVAPVRVSPCISRYLPVSPVASISRLVAGRTGACLRVRLVAPECT